MRKRPTTTVQPLWRVDPDGHDYAASMIRLRGDWVADIFPPGTRLIITREERRGEIVLVLERLPEPETQLEGGVTLSGE